MLAYLVEHGILHREGAQCRITSYNVCYTKLLRRIFDSLNYAENLYPAMEAVLEDGRAVCEAAICYTGNILDPKRNKYDLEYYIAMAKDLEKRGAHILAIKDMAGLLRPYAADVLFRALKSEVGIPIHYHTHDTSGINAASVLRAVDAGVDVVDGAIAGLSGSIV